MEEIKALELFENSCNCSQSVLAAVGTKYGITEQQALALGSGFGAGMCFQGKICGAVTGAYMALGLISGKKFTQAEDIKEYTYLLLRKFNTAFVEIYKTVECNNLLGIDIGAEKGLQEAVSSGVFQKKCPMYVKKAVEILKNIE